jgi:uncharacterized membrane protein YhaH (DUF805 family)
MEMINWYKKVVFENYLNFSGRARRSEFWYFTLMSIIISIVIGIIEGALGIGAYEANEFGFRMQGGIISNLYSLAVFLPGLAVSIRRLQDTGKSGWNMLLVLIPLVGAIILIVFFATEGDKGKNEYGPDPKNPEMTTEDHLLDLD